MDNSPNSSLEELLDESLLLFWDPTPTCQRTINNDISEESSLPFWDSVCPMKDSDDALCQTPHIVQDPPTKPKMLQSGSGQTRIDSFYPPILASKRPRIDIDDSAVPGPSRMDFNEIDFSSIIVLKEKRRRTNKKYNAEEITYEARIKQSELPDQLREEALGSIIETVRQLFQHLIDRCTKNLISSDMIRVLVQAEGLDKPISTRLMNVSSLTVETIMSSVMKVLQSKASIALNEGFFIDVVTVKRPVGAGGVSHRRISNISLQKLKKRSIITVPSNDDSQLCCAKAIIYAIAVLEGNKTLIQSFRNGNRPALLNRAEELHVAAGVPFAPCGLPEIARFEDYLDIQICLVSSDNLNRVTYKGKERIRRIYIWHNDQHYDVIKSMPGFYGAKAFCSKCDKPYDHLVNHRCPGRCHICYDINCVEGEKIRCHDCDRNCLSEECYNRHKAISGNQRLSICDNQYQCKKCSKIIQRRVCKMQHHVCGQRKCLSCGKFVDLADHRCFLRRIEPKSPNQKLIFFDFETDQSSGEHVVNLAIFQYANGEEKVFCGYSACDDFCSFLFTPEHKEYVAVAHNMKGFDGQFIMAWLLKQGIAPEVIPNGTKLMSIRLKSLNITIIDSFNFLPMALSKLPSTFGIGELKKGYFPHLFNKKENQKYIGPLPPLECYSPDTMSSRDRLEFLRWYEEHSTFTFNFEEEIIAYCRSDVDILRRCCLEFRSQFLDVTNVDPFRYVTIASACMATFRGNHLLDETIAMIPVTGYVNKTTYSRDSIRWLDYISLKYGIAIEHALNGGGEKIIEGISIDGFSIEENTIYLFQGCFYHGCDQCHEGDVVNPVTGLKMGHMFQKSRDSVSKFKSKGYSVVEMWEHNFTVMKKTDPDLKLFLRNHDVVDRLVPRDSFFGGRTNAVRLFHEGNIKYIDFTSLYPWVNKYCTYPVGHPKIITENFTDIDDYFGLMKCRVNPPKGLFHPVLPYRCQGKLMFPLCRTCADTLQQTECRHLESERSITGTWVTEELKIAKKKGYKIVQIFEVYHFEKTSTNFFRSYIDCFLKLKQESSGWPNGCNTEQEKAEYIRNYDREEGVSLNPNAISKNPGRRQVAKLALNSFWGRWGMNCQKSHLSFVTSIPEFNKMILDETKEISDLYLTTEEIAAIHWMQKDEFMPQDSATNIFLASFTTSYARLKLYEEIDKLGEAVLYFDTDSIVYESDGNNDPALGNYLGQFTDELEGDVITTFVSGGAKNYAYVTSNGKTECKVRGFTLNFKNSLCLNYHSVKNLVKNMDTSTHIPIHNPMKMQRDAKRRKIINKPEIKNYRIVYNKRVVKDDFKTVPYGF